MCRKSKNDCLQSFETSILDDGDFFERSNAFGPNHHLVNIQKLIFTHFRTLFVYLTQKKIRSYLDDNDKANLQEKGYLPIIIILRPNNTQPRQTSFKN